MTSLTEKEFTGLKVAMLTMVTMMTATIMELESLSANVGLSTMDNGNEAVDVDLPIFMTQKLASLPEANGILMLW